MNRALIAIAGLALTTGVAAAEFIGVTVRQDKTVDTSGLPGTPDVFNIYAVFDGDANDDIRNTVLSVGSAFIEISQENQPGATFFQDPNGFNGSLPPSATLAAAFPGVAADSYVGIGNKVDDGTDTSGLDGDFDADGFSPTTLIGGWFNSSPPNLAGAPVFNPDTGQYETFLAQLSIADGTDAAAGEGFNGTSVDTNWLSNVFLGELTVNRQGDTSLGEPTAVGFTVSFNKIPTPGALALFGVAGLAAARRRR